MREHKYRAWDKHRKEYLSAGQVLLAILPGARPEHNPIYLDVLKCADVYRERFVLEQFTGMCDKNGEGIYEGDIVKFNSRVGEVVFTCGCFGIGFRKCIDYDSMLKEIHEYTGCDNRLYACENDNFISLWEIWWNYNEEDQRLEAVEVIGNIHENPELLEANP